MTLFVFVPLTLISNSAPIDFVNSIRLFAAIKLNLNGPDLRSGTKYYERVKNALSHKLLSNKSFRICWTPPDASICRSSVAKYFADRQQNVELVETQVKLHQEYSLEVPLVGENDLMENVEKLFATPHELAEYVGMLSLSCSLDGDEYLNSYKCVGDSVNVGSAKVIQWNGMFDCLSMVQLFDELKYVTVVRLYNAFRLIPLVLCLLQTVCDRSH